VSETPLYELFLFVAPKSADCDVAQSQASAAAIQLGLPFRMIDASRPESGRLVLAFNITEIPTLALVRHGKFARAFEHPSDFKTATLVDRLTKHLAKDASRG
jgi:hypothetical protein